MLEKASTLIRLMLQKLRRLLWEIRDRLPPSEAIVTALVAAMIAGGCLDAIHRLMGW